MLPALIAALGLAGCSVPPPTHHCKAVVAQRAEAMLVYPGARVLDRSANEGTGQIGGETEPWAAQDIEVATSEQRVFAWYAGWLRAHGWSHLKDARSTDSNNVPDADYSNWTRGDEFFTVSVVLSAQARVDETVIDSDRLLVSTEYDAPGSVLGCS